ncbi:MAG: aminotransferase class V-fold PLP-dependent enzyme [Myxococcota bacterium]
MHPAFTLDPTITFLNHGSYGACPLAVQQAQSLLRAQLEAEPVRFMTRELEPLLDASRARLADFLGARPADLAFVPNATTGVNAVLRSLTLQPGDELVTTNHGYNACTNALRFVAERAGARVVIAQVPFPLEAAEQALEAVRRAVTPRTRLVLFDQITSPTALVFPVDALVKELETSGVRVLVDAAHAPGMLPLHLDETGASYTTGNLHKWVCAPKGAAFLHVRRDRQAEVRPAVISHGANSRRTDKSRFQLEFDWTGTGDPTAYLCVPQALDVMASLHPDGWPGLMRANRDAATKAGELLSEALQPFRGARSLPGASMVSVEVPGPPDGLQDRLFHHHRIEVPIIPFEGKTLVRVSMQAHTSLDDVERLARVLPRLG